MYGVVCGEVCGVCTACRVKCVVCVKCVMSVTGVLCGESGVWIGLWWDYWPLLLPVLCRSKGCNLMSFFILIPARLFVVLLLVLIGQGLCPVN